MAKTSSRQFITGLKEILSEHFTEDDSFIMGVSGGPDSMALLYLMRLIQRKVFVVHINYGKRNKAADKDQELVEQMAFAWGFECCSITLDPKAADGQNFQNWAREQRYQYFRDLKEDQNASAIITAHHKDDQVETILQKILRGSAPSAWHGMSIRDGDIFRPLLHFDKEQILSLCKSEAIPFRLDESNESTDYARNFIRHDFSQKMDELFPGWQQNLLNLSDFSSSYSSAIGFVLEQVTDENTIKLTDFTDLPPELRSAVLKEFFDLHGLKGLYSKHQIREFSDLDSLQTGKSLQVGDYRLTRDRNLIHLHKDTAIYSHQSVPITKSDVETGFSGEFFTLSLSDRVPESAELRMDSSKMNWPLEIRTWQNGDAFNPLGLNGTQKISDHLTNRKIPTILREKTLVLCGSDGTIYAIIYPDNADIRHRGAISDIAKCDDTTKTYLTINF